MKIHRANVEGVDVVQIPAVNSERPPIAIELLDPAALPPTKGNYAPIDNAYPGRIPELGHAAVEGVVRVDSL